MDNHVFAGYAELLNSIQQFGSVSCRRSKLERKIVLVDTFNKTPASLMNLFKRSAKD